MKYIMNASLNFQKLMDASSEDIDDNVCNISGKPLLEHHVVMECGHAFNYLPLYHDLLFHKYESNHSEMSGKLQPNEIRCPYCRSKSTILIPFYENIEIVPGITVRPVMGINVYFDENEQKQNINKINTTNKKIWGTEKKQINKYYKKQFKEIKRNKNK